MILRRSDRVTVPPHRRRLVPSGSTSMQAGPSIACSPKGSYEADPSPSSNEGSKYSESNFTLDATQDDQRFVRDRHFRIGCELLRACGTNDEAKVTKIMETEPRMSTFKDYDGRTALHVASSEGRLELVRLGLGSGLGLA